MIFNSIRLSFMYCFIVVGPGRSRMLAMSLTFTDFNLSVGCFGIDTEMVDPKTHEMVSDRSSRAENWTDLRKISKRVFFGSEKSRKKTK